MRAEKCLRSVVSTHGQTLKWNFLLQMEKSVLTSQVLATTVQVDCGRTPVEEVLQTILLLVVLFALLSPHNLRILTWNFKFNERIWIFRSKVKVAVASAGPSVMNRAASREYRNEPQDFFHQPSPPSGPTTGVFFTGGSPPAVHERSTHQSFISTTSRFTVAAGCKKV